MKHCKPNTPILKSLEKGVKICPFVTRIFATKSDKRFIFYMTNSTTEVLVVETLVTEEFFFELLNTLQLKNPAKIREYETSQKNTTYTYINTGKQKEVPRKLDSTVKDHEKQQSSTAMWILIVCLSFMAIFSVSALLKLLLLLFVL